ncbi:MAG TPA: dihydrodipicolinate synthase family protein [Pyrinomonadaceae bacterium]|nr:dihydrodipicolinate synthase family protein [Pyrinomonadaceae bacterium]
MNATTKLSENLRGVFAVPPLARKPDAKRSIDFDQNGLLVRHIVKGGINRLLYGGNAFLYHITLAEYEQLLGWLSGLNDEAWVIPSIGPSYGRAMDQAMLMRQHRFPCAMMLPASDPRDALGLELGLREIAEAAQTRLIIYLKDENNFGPDRNAGLDAVARLIDDDLCVAIKYAIVRQDPGRDAYLEALLQRVDRKFVISGIGERPAIVHLRDWNLPGFTTGSGCIAPRLSQKLFEACGTEDFETALRLRAEFIPLEDLRDLWGPARVLHSATDLAGIAATGPVPPYLTGLSTEQEQMLTPVARSLFDSDKLQLVGAA